MESLSYGNATALSHSSSMPWVVAYEGPVDHRGQIYDYDERDRREHHFF